MCPDKIDVVYDAVAANHPSAQWSPNGPVVTLATVDPQKGRDLASEAAELAHVPIVFSENLATDLQHASVFLYLTRSEGFGSAALLAMSMGVPIIASRVGGLVEVLDEGRAGMLVDNEPSQIAAAIQLVIRQPTFAAGLIERARRRVCETFTPDHLIEATLSSYRRALGG
jgi:glycosyltransferase involved in cell wall biosynthesis